MNEEDWEIDSSDRWGYVLRNCGLCEGLFKGSRDRWLCRVCSLEGKMKRMVPPRAKDALDPVVRNIDLGDR